MPIYRVYVIQHGTPKTLNCDTHVEAIEQARSLVAEPDFELCQGLRMVVAVERASVQTGKVHAARLIPRSRRRPGISRAGGRQAIALTGRATSC